MRCEGVTYVTFEHEGELLAECDAGPHGDCLFREPLDFGVTSKEWGELHERHLAHSRGDA